MTFEEMLVLAAKEGGDASYDSNGRPMVPTDPEALYRAEEAIKTAIRRLIASYDWSWRDQELTFGIGPTANPLTVDGATDRYRMPWDFGGAYNTLAYRDDSLLIEVVDSRVIEQMRADQYDSTGDPVYAAFARSQGGVTGYDMLVWPKPDTARTLLLRYQAYPNLPQNLGDQFIAGPEFNAALEAAITLAVHERVNSNRLPTSQEAYYREVNSARERDMRTRSGIVGNLGGDGVPTGPMPPCRTITVNNETIYV